MNMLERFFSIEYAGQGEIFEGLAIWSDEKYRKLQGTYPVIFLSFADIKANNFSLAREKICMIIQKLYSKFEFLLGSHILRKNEEKFFDKIFVEMTDFIRGMFNSTFKTNPYLERAVKI